MILCHYAACLWYLVGLRDLPARCNGEPWRCDDLGDTWFRTMDMDVINNSKRDPRFNLYVTSIYFVMATMTTVGFGDIHPISPTEMQYSVVMFLIAIGSFSTSVGSITDLVVQAG